MQLTIGADPEFFVQQIPKEDQTADGLSSDKAVTLAIERIMAKAKKDKEPKFTLAEDRLVPICGMLGGTKTSPMPLPLLGEGYAVQEDGIAAEFNIPPATSPQQFAVSIGRAVSYIERDLLRPRGLQRSFLSSVNLKKEWVEKFPTIAQIGCDPDFCAYEAADGVATPRTNISDQAGLVRGTGGHIHLGYDLSIVPPEILAQLLDLTLGLRYIATGDDRQGDRRRIWGVAGLFRPKSYGIEYRTLSNFWIWSNSAALEVAGISFQLIRSIANNAIPWQALHNVVHWEGVRNIILREDMDEAQDMIQKLKNSHDVYLDVVDRGAAVSSRE